MPVEAGSSTADAVWETRRGQGAPPKVLSSTVILYLLFLIK